MRDARLVEQVRLALEPAPPEVVAAYLYGNQARGDARVDSNLDLAVLLAKPPRPTLQIMARELEATLSKALRLPTRVVALNGASADLVHGVLRDGVVVLDRDRAARLGFEVRARNEYFDLASLRRLRRRIPA